jgi:hypothetical protein
MDHVAAAAYQEDKEDKPSVYKFWRGINIKEAFDDTGASLEEVIQTTMNDMWQNMWSKCTDGVQELAIAPKVRL